MADKPDTHPDSVPTGTGDSPEQVNPGKTERRKGVEDSPGDYGDTAGTGGVNKVQQQGFER
jgi:hypothetical protein